MTTKVWIVRNRLTGLIHREMAFTDEARAEKLAAALNARMDPYTHQYVVYFLNLVEGAEWGGR